MIYTDNDRYLCCTICGDASVVISRVEVPDDLNGTTLLVMCRDCGGGSAIRFVRDGARTRVNTATTDLNRAALARAAGYWLIDPDLPSPRPASDSPAVHHIDTGEAS